MSKTTQNNFIVEIDKWTEKLPEKRLSKIRKNASHSADRQSMLNADLQLPYSSIPKPLSSKFQTETLPKRLTNSNQ